MFRPLRLSLIGKSKFFSQCFLIGNLIIGYDCNKNRCTAEKKQEAISNLPANAILSIKYLKTFIIATEVNDAENSLFMQKFPGDNKIF